MTGRSVRGSEVGTKKDRRSPVGQRVHFEAMVAVGGAGGGFEAESVDLSQEGMRLRTAYLPGVGDKIVCRFDGLDGEVVALGEVLWTTEAARGGEFAVRFVDLDEETAAALKSLIDIDEPEPPPAPEEPKAGRGTRVKLHIEGLASPMKARVKDATQTELRVGSSLEFLKLGRHVDVEDVDNASRREGFVDGVRVEIDPGTSVPQLVVSLRFEAAVAKAVAALQDTQKSPVPVEAEPTKADAEAEDDAVDEPVPATKAATRVVVPSKSKAKPAPIEAEAKDADEADPQADLGLPGAKLRAAKDRAAQVGVAAASAVGPALSRVSSGARDLFASLRGGLAKRRQDRAEAKKASAPRRITAPPPSGALTSEGKRLVRQDSGDDEAPPSESPKKSRRGLAIGAGAGLLVVLGVFGVSRAMTSDKDVAAQPVTAADVRGKQPSQDVPPIPGAPAMGDVPLFGPTPLSTTETVMPTPPQADKAKAGADVGDEEAADEKPAKSEVIREWGNGEVSNPKVLKVRMDGPVSGFTATEAEGGFDVVVPGRKSLSTSTALVRKDKRIASLDVIPREDATEINVRFKGEPPAYLVKVRSDRVEIALGGEKKEGENKKVASKKTAEKKKTDKKKAPKK